MDFKNTHSQEHDFLISLGYEEKQYGYVRYNDNETVQIVTPFDNYQFQIWCTPAEQEYDEKIYDTSIVQFSGFPQFQSFVILFEQIKERE